MLHTLFRKLEQQRIETLKEFIEFRSEVRKIALKQASDEQRSRELLELVKRYDRGEGSAPSAG